MFDEITGVILTIIKSIVDTKLARAYLGIATITVISLIAYRGFSGVLFAQTPTVTLTYPKINAEVNGKQLYIQGSVTPVTSLVKINGQSVYSNGDGSFSQVIDISEGKNILKVSAENYGKSSSIVQLVTRTLTADEIAAKQVEQQKEEAKIKADADKIAQAQQAESVLAAEAPSPVPSVTPAPTIAPEPPTPVEFNQENIVTKQVTPLPQGGATISGKYQNKTGKTIRWVKITAQLKDEQGNIVETKDAYVTQSNQLLAPSATVEYTVPIVTTVYKSFDLTTSYELIP